MGSSILPALVTSKFSANSITYAVADYDLEATLTSGQAFRWRKRGSGWEGVIGTHWVHLESTQEGFRAQTAEPVKDWTWLRNYMQVEVNLEDVLASFPTDTPMQAAVKACHGLRLLRQDPWECLASFILSATKQIVQIQQVIGKMCSEYGQPVATPAGVSPWNAFPTPERLSRCSEAELLSCKMGFRAPRLLAAAQAVNSGRLDLDGISRCSLTEAEVILTRLPGVGPKIAQCVLLFAYGFPTAFPIDVWIQRALRELYFEGQKVNMVPLREFVLSHFGPQAGYAQQYLFHYMRTRRC